MSLEALIFDLDGTMADTEEAHRQAFNEAFEKLELRWNWSPLRYSELLEISGGVDRLHHYIDTLDIAQDEKTRLHELVPIIHRVKSDVYAESILAGRPPLRPGVRRLIGDARAAGLKVGVVSTTAAANAIALLAAHVGPFWHDHIDALVSAEEVAHGKPAPDIYERALALLDKPARACVAFEDSVNGLRAAKAAGVYTVVTPTRWTMAHDFSGADLLLRGLGDPDVPLHEGDQRTVGAEQLEIAHLTRLHDPVRRSGVLAELPETD